MTPCKCGFSPRYVFILIPLALLIMPYLLRLPQTNLHVNRSAKFHRVKSPNSSILILYWTRVFGRSVSIMGSPFRWPFFYLEPNCPVKCEISTDKSRLEEASALVIHGRNTDEMPTSKASLSLPWILHVNENPLYAWSLRDHSVMAKFDYLATYRLDSDFPCPEFVKPDTTKPTPFQEKRLVMAVYSSLEFIRTVYMFRLSKYLHLDSYGDRMQNQPRLPGGKTDTKERMRGYKFTLVFPNADCDYYMTEKIYNALSAGSVPVWMGTDKIDEVLQWGNLKHSFIKVKDYPSPKKLAEYLLYLAGNENEYNKYLKWKYEGFQFPREYYQSPIGQWWDGFSLYCRICMRIANNSLGHNGFPPDLCDGKQRRTLEKWITE